MSKASDAKIPKLLDTNDNNDLVTRKECELVLKKVLIEENKRGILDSYELIQDIDAAGSLGEYYHLNLKCQLENEEELVEKRFFVKTMPYHNSDMLAYCQKSRIFRKEGLIYTEVLNEMRQLSPNIWCPQCYLVKPDLLILQDIRNLGYEPIQDTSKFLNRKEIETILRGLASMHASSLVYEQRNNLKIGDVLEDVLYDLKVGSQIGWYTAGAKALLAVALKEPLCQAEVLQIFIQNDLPEKLNSIYSMISHSSKYCNVLCHRDIFGGNVCFAKNDPHKKGAAFVDFQMCRYSPAAIDVLIVLYLNMRPNDRKSIECECYKFYYDEFSREMAKMDVCADDFMKYDEFLLSLKEFSLFGAIYNCVAATILRVPVNYLSNMKYFRPMEYDHYMNVDRTKEILELMRKNTQFKDYMSECVMDMMDLLLKCN